MTLSVSVGSTDLASAAPEEFGWAVYTAALASVPAAEQANAQVAVQVRDESVAVVEVGDLALSAVASLVDVVRMTTCEDVQGECLATLDFSGRRRDRRQLQAEQADLTVTRVYDYVHSPGVGVSVSERIAAAFDRTNLTNATVASVELTALSAETAVEVVGTSDASETDEAFADGLQLSSQLALRLPSLAVTVSTPVLIAPPPPPSPPPPSSSPSEPLVAPSSPSLPLVVDGADVVGSIGTEGAVGPSLWLVSIMVAAALLVASVVLIIYYCLRRPRDAKAARRTRVAPNPISPRAATRGGTGRVRVQPPEEPPATAPATDLSLNPSCTLLNPPVTVASTTVVERAEAALRSSLHVRGQDGQVIEDTIDAVRCAPDRYAKRESSHGAFARALLGESNGDTSVVRESNGDTSAVVPREKAAPTAVDLSAARAEIQAVDKRAAAEHMHAKAVERQRHVREATEAYANQAHAEATARASEQQSSSAQQHVNQDRREAFAVPAVRASSSGAPVVATSIVGHDEHAAEHVHASAAATHAHAAEPAAAAPVAAANAWRSPSVQSVAYLGKYATTLNSRVSRPDRMAPVLPPSAETTRRSRPGSAKARASDVAPLKAHVSMSGVATEEALAAELAKLLAKKSARSGTLRGAEHTQWDAVGYGPSRGSEGEIGVSTHGELGVRVRVPHLSMTQKEWAQQVIGRAVRRYVLTKRMAIE